MQNRDQSLLLEELQGIQPGTPEYFAVQRNVIQENALLNRCYKIWYDCIERDLKSVSVSRPVFLELGSGGSFLKDRFPELITSDVVAGVADRVIDARQIPFEDSSLAGMALTHAFHHIPDVHKFLSEARRTLVPGGVVSMIEVAHTPFAKWIFGNFHPEPFNDRVCEWSFSSSSNMLDANQALSWIVFFRDAPLFAKEFPELVLEEVGFLPWLSYLLSGGVTRKKWFPDFLTPFVIWADTLLKPLDRFFALHWSMRVRKINSRGIPSDPG